MGRNTIKAVGSLIAAMIYKCWILCSTKTLININNNTVLYCGIYHTYTVPDTCRFWTGGLWLYISEPSGMT